MGKLPGPEFSPSYDKKTGLGESGELGSGHRVSKWWRQDETRQRKPAVPCDLICVNDALPSLDLPPL